MNASDSPASPLDGLLIVDADTHFSEPHDLWVSRAPASWKSRVPQVITVDGTRQWMIDGEKLIEEGGGHHSAIRSDGSKAEGWGFWTLPFEEIHPAAYDIRARLQHMDAQGVWAQIVYPNVMGFGGQRAAGFDRELKRISVEIYNDAMVDLQRDSGGRLCPMALLPWWDVPLAVAEARRAAAMGLRGININPDPQSVAGLPDLGTRDWDPLWEICEALSLPVNFHIGSSGGALDWFGHAPWPSSDWDTKLVIGSAALYWNNSRIIMNLMMSGLLDRFPKLQFVSIEGGIGWIPFMLQAMEYLIGEGSGAMRQRMSLTPTEYFARNFHACFWFENRGLAEIVSRVGADRILFETDFPHPACLYPAFTPSLVAELGRLDLQSRRRIMGLNAQHLYAIAGPDPSAVATAPSERA